MLPFLTLLWSKDSSNWSMSKYHFINISFVQWAFLYSVRFLLTHPVLLKKASLWNFQWCSLHYEIFSGEHQLERAAVQNLSWLDSREPTLVPKVKLTSTLLFSPFHPDCRMTFLTLLESSKCYFGFQCYFGFSCRPMFESYISNLCSGLKSLKRAIFGPVGGNGLKFWRLHTAISWLSMVTKSHFRTIII